VLYIYIVNLKSFDDQFRPSKSFRNENNGWFKVKRSENAKVGVKSPTDLGVDSHNTCGENNTQKLMENGVILPQLSACDSLFQPLWIVCDVWVTLPSLGLLGVKQTFFVVPVELKRKFGLFMRNCC